jgi:hypothetical protein
MRTVPLDEQASGTVAADGTCEVTIGPISRQTWTVQMVSVSCSSSASSPTAKLYLGPSKQGRYIAGTYDGINDNMPCNVDLPQGARITVVWEDGDPGARCLVGVLGTMKVPN